MQELWGMRSTPSFPLLPRVEALDRVLSVGQKEPNCVLMLNWQTWNRSFILTDYLCKTQLFEKEMFWHLTVWTKAILILNWIGWIRTVWLNWIALTNCLLILNWFFLNKYLYKSNLHKLVCHKTQRNKQSKRYWVIFSNWCR